MAQKYGFFNSVNNDRVYDASDVAGFLKSSSQMVFLIIV